MYGFYVAEQSYPAYRFEYGVHDPHTGDIKKQYEERDGDTVRGYYSLVEPDGSIRLVEYTADSKNGFQAVVKKIGHSHHPTTVTHHLNTANHHDGGGGYAPNYHSGHQQHYSSDNDHHQSLTPVYNNHYEPPPVYNNHYEPPVYTNHYEPPVPTYNNHYEPSHTYGNHYNQPSPPAPAYNHYEPPLVPAHNNHYQSASSPTYNHHYEPPAVPAHYEHPETADFEHGPPLFAGSLPSTDHGDYGSASPEEYYPAPLQFPVRSHENSNFDWPAAKDEDVDVVDSSEHHHGTLAKGNSAERPEYLRKYFEPNYRSHGVVNSYYDGDEF